MVKLEFKSTDEFEKLFRSKSKAVTDAIFQAIEEAVESNVKTANLFQISFEEADIEYEITLPSSQWGTALQSCLEFYTNLGESDSAIDVFLLQKKTKNK